MVRPEDCSIHPRAVDRHGIHEIGGPLMVGGADFLSPRTALFRDISVRDMLNSEQRFQAYLQFREQAFRIAATQLVSLSNSPVDLFPLTGVDGEHSRSAYVFAHIMYRDTHHSIVADDQRNGSGVDNISTICYVPEDEIRRYKNEKKSFLCRLHYSQRYFAYRKGLVKLEFIQSNCDPEEALKRLKSSTVWSEMQDYELRRCLEAHMDLLKEHEMSKMDAASSKSEYENVALEKINMELGSVLDEKLTEFDWTIMGLYYTRTKLRNLARECAIQCQAQTTGVFLVEEALPVRGYLKEHMLSASPKVRKLPFMKQTVKQLLEGGMGSLRGIAEQFGRGAARGMADAGHYEFLDPLLDAHHRSCLSTMLSPPPEGEAPIELGSLRLRTPIRAWRLYSDWLSRLRAAGLLPLARMMEATWEDDQDRGEMAPTLQDVGYLIGYCSHMNNTS